MERIWAITAFQSGPLDIFPAQHRETNICTSSLVLMRLSKGHINVPDLRNWQKNNMFRYIYLWRGLCPCIVHRFAFVLNCGIVCCETLKFLW